MLAVAFPHPRFFEIDHVIGSAMRTPNHAIGPPQFHHEMAAVFVILEVDDCVLKGPG